MILLSINRFLKIALFSTVLAYSQSPYAHDGICSYGGSTDSLNKNLTIDPITLPSVSWSGAANAIPPIWVTTSVNGSKLSCSFRTVTSKMTFTAQTAPTGKFITVNGTSYPIFATPTNGIGYILALNTLSNAPVIIGSGTLFIGNNDSMDGNGFKFNQRLQLVSMGTLPNGSFTIPSMTLGTLSIIPTTNPTDYGGSITGNTQTRQLISNATTITLAAKTCSPTINNIQVTFPELFIYKDTFWANPVPQNFNLGLNCTQGPINAYITFSDANTPGNNSNILSLDPTSTASGVGIQIKYNNGPPINYGLDSPNAGNSGQFLLQSNLSGLVSLPFTASLIKTGTMKAGSFTARATFTFSYQ